MPDVTGMQIIVTRPTKLFGAFYQTPYDDDPRIKDLKALLEVISDDDSDEVQFIEIEAENCVAYGFMNTTKLKSSWKVNARVNIEGIVKRKIIPVLDDTNLETDDHIYDFGNGVNVYLDYTFTK